MTNIHYQKIQKLRNEIGRYQLLMATAFEVGGLVKYNPNARREFISQLDFARERLIAENPEFQFNK